MLLPCLQAQSSSVLAVAPPPKITLKRNTIVGTRLAVQLRSGYHVNSNTPSEDYLIPLRLVWESRPFEILEVVYPRPKLEKYDFSARPVSVFTGDFEILTRLRTPADAQRGPGILLGQLRYQACTNNLCLPPKTVEVRLPYEIR